MITGAPILLSTPHFYMGDEKYSNAFIGVKPNKEWHETHIDLEPVMNERLIKSSNYYRNLIVFSSKISFS